MSGVKDDPHGATLARAVTSRAPGLGVEVLAAGVESEEQGARLEEIGCTFAHGFEVSPPLDEEGSSTGCNSRLRRWERGHQRTKVAA